METPSRSWRIPAQNRTIDKRKTEAMKTLTLIASMLLLASCSKDKQISLVNQSQINSEIQDIDSVVYVDNITQKVISVQYGTAYYHELLLVIPDETPLNQSHVLKGCNNIQVGSATVVYYRDAKGFCKAASGRAELLTQGFKVKTLNIYDCIIEDNGEKLKFEVRYSK